MHTLLPFVLVNSFWQVCLLGLLTSVLLRMLRSPTASTRFLVWSVCLAGCIFIPIASVAFPAARFVSVKSVKTRFVASANTPGRPLNVLQLVPPGIGRISAVSDPSLLLGLWSLYGVAVFLGLCRLSMAAIRTNLLLQQARVLASPSFDESLIQKVMKEHRVGRIEVVTTSLGVSPASLHWPHAILILPSSLDGSSETELRAALSHEFAHIRRYDFQTNVLIELGLVLVFFHPVAHWIKRRVDESREAACDDLAAIHLQSYKQYANALLSLAQRRQTSISRPSLSLGIAETTHLEKRIMRLLTPRLAKSPFRGILGILTAAAGMIAIVSGVAAIGLHPTVRAAVRTIETETRPEVLIPASTRKGAPDFALPDANGKPIILSKYKGEVVLVNFWATWCGGCKLEIPWYIQFDKKYRDKGLRIIGVSMDGDGWKAVKPFLAKKMDDETGGYIAMGYPVVIGSDPLASKFGLTSMPMSILIDKEGRVALSHTGVIDRESFEENIQTLLK